MTRRTVLLGIAAIVVFASALAWAQERNRTPLLGVLLTVPAPDIIEALRQGLRDHGYVEDRNIAITLRTAEGQSDRLARLAEELVQLNPDVIVVGNSRAAQAVKRITSTIPIVIVTSDPVAAGVVTNLAHPGGNVTGVSTMTTELTAKRLQLLKETIRGLTRVGVLWNPAKPPTPFQAKVAKDLKAAAAAMAIELKIVTAASPEEFSTAFADISSAQVQALYLVENPLFYGNLRTLAALALQARLPAIYGTKAFAQNGGLMSYGADYADQARRAAGYVDKILKGAAPGDLPIEQATEVEFIINLKTAKALGLAIPQTVLTRVNEVIR